MAANMNRLDRLTQILENITSQLKAGLENLKEDRTARLDHIHATMRGVASALMHIEILFKAIDYFNKTTVKGQRLEVHYVQILNKIEPTINALLNQPVRKLLDQKAQNQINEMRKFQTSRFDQHQSLNIENAVALDRAITAVSRHKQGINKELGEMNRHGKARRAQLGIARSGGGVGGLHKAAEPNRVGREGGGTPEQKALADALRGFNEQFGAASTPVSSRSPGEMVDPAAPLTPQGDAMRDAGGIRPNRSENERLPSRISIIKAATTPLKSTPDINIGDGPRILDSDIKRSAQTTSVSLTSSTDSTSATIPDREQIKKEIEDREENKRNVDLAEIRFQELKKQIEAFIRDEINSKLQRLQNTGMSETTAQELRDSVHGILLNELRENMAHYISREFQGQLYEKLEKTYGEMLIRIQTENKKKLDRHFSAVKAEVARDIDTVIESRRREDHARMDSLTRNQAVIQNAIEEINTRRIEIDTRIEDRLREDAAAIIEHRTAIADLQASRVPIEEIAHQVRIQLEPALTVVEEKANVEAGVVRQEIDHLSRVLTEIERKRNEENATREAKISADLSGERRLIEDSIASVRVETRKQLATVVRDLDIERRARLDGERDRDRKAINDRKTAEDAAAVVATASAAAVMAQKQADKIAADLATAEIARTTDNAANKKTIEALAAIVAAQKKALDDATAAITAAKVREDKIAAGLAATQAMLSTLTAAGLPFASLLANMPALTALIPHSAALLTVAGHAPVLAAGAADLAAIAGQGGALAAGVADLNAIHGHGAALAAMAPHSLALASLAPVTTSLVNAVPMISAITPQYARLQTLLNEGATVGQVPGIMSSEFATMYRNMSQHGSPANPKVRR